jgi:PII-like signaling protein
LRGRLSARQAHLQGAAALRVVLGFGGVGAHLVSITEWSVDRG